MNQATAKSMLVVDDHPVVALGIELALRATKDLNIAGAVAAPSDVLQAIAACAPDALVADLAFSGTIHLSLIRQCRTALPDGIIVVFSSLPEKLYRSPALDAGADAYLTKDHDLSDLIGLVQGLLAPPGLTPRTKPAKPQPGPLHSGPNIFGEGAHLTRRETEIAPLIGRGLTLSEIGAMTGLSQNTVAVHRENIRKKLGCRDSMELGVRLARFFAMRSAND